MIDRFKKHHWYCFNGKASSVYIDADGNIDVRPHEEFMLDGKWHQCKEVRSHYYTGYFYDSSEPDRYCIFGDAREPKGERLYMFDELSPAMYNIKKLKDLKEK